MRHTSQGRARGQDHGTLDDWEDGYDARHDPGSHTATNQRQALQRPSASELTRRLNPGQPWGMTGAPIPCRLCQPGDPCSFHQEGVPEAPD